MTIILTNDDGIDAPGIQALKKALDDSQGSYQSVTVAPKVQHSGCGHQVTTHRGIHVEKRTAEAYAVDGTPADCTRIGICQLDLDTKWVLSGINAGGNLGTDVYISGTVAAVREAAMHGISGIAISHWIKRPLMIDWDWAAFWTGRVLVDLMSRPPVKGSFWNVNLPHLEADAKDPEIMFCQASIDPLPVDFRTEGDIYHYQGKYSERDRTSGTDVDVCFSGNIAVTQISL